MLPTRVSLYPPCYVLTLEPLLNKLRLNLDIKGLLIGDRELKVAAFADDILLSLRLLYIILPNLFKDVDHFDTLSNLKINYMKSHA